MLFSVILVLLTIVSCTSSAPTLPPTSYDITPDKSSHSAPTYRNIFRPPLPKANKTAIANLPRPPAPYLFQYNRLNCYVNFTDFGYDLGPLAAQAVLSVY